MARFDIRATQSCRADEVLSLYPQAFPEEDLTGLVAEVLALSAGCVSLGAFSETGTLIGHVIFSECLVPQGGEGDVAVALLGPLAVHPDHQHSGIGGALVRAGIADLSARGVAEVCVLGDPAYYQRFGFRTCTDIKAPYDLPEDWGPAWQSLSLRPSGGQVAGRLQVPAPWRNPAYWAP